MFSEGDFHSRVEEPLADHIAAACGACFPHSFLVILRSGALCARSLSEDQHFSFEVLLVVLIFASVANIFHPIARTRFSIARALPAILKQLFHALLSLSGVHPSAVSKSNSRRKQYFNV